VSAPDELDCLHNSALKCPHCGHDLDDSWEYFDSGAEECLGIECEECGGVFDASVTVTCTYSTRKEEDAA
jgi:uncharacterized Zn finger protein